MYFIQVLMFLIQIYLNVFYYDFIVKNLYLKKIRLKINKN